MKKVLPGVADIVKLEFEQAELGRAMDVLNRIESGWFELRTEKDAPARVVLFDRAGRPDAPVKVPYARMGIAALVGFCLPFVLVVGWERIVRRIGDAGTAREGDESGGDRGDCPPAGEDQEAARRDLAADDAEPAALRGKHRQHEDLSGACRGFEGRQGVRGHQRNGHEGKTSVAAQLALSLARASGKPTLLIDGDMRDPDLHDVFEVARTPGLAEVLAGDCELESAIVPSWSPHVFLLPAGELKTSPHQLVGNGALRSVLERTSEKYGYVVIDTPPILSAAESLVLAKAADASLVCAMQDVSRAGQVRSACQRLVAAGCRPVAAVLNGVSPRHYGYRYGSIRTRDQLTARARRVVSGGHNPMSRYEKTERGASRRRGAVGGVVRRTLNLRLLSITLVACRWWESDRTSGERIRFLGPPKPFSTVRTRWRRKASLPPPIDYRRRYLQFHPEDDNAFVQLGETLDEAAGISARRGKGRPSAFFWALSSSKAWNRTGNRNSASARRNCSWTSRTTRPPKSRPRRLWDSTPAAGRSSSPSMRTIRGAPRPGAGVVRPAPARRSQGRTRRRIRRRRRTPAGRWN